VKRLSLYLRTLDAAAADGQPTISSSAIARVFDFTDAQVRRDLACLGPAGRPGIGYSPAPLAVRIRAALSLDRTWNLAIVGTGKIGTALMGYPQFAGGGFRVTAAFDSDPTRIGTTIFDVVIHPLARLGEVIAQTNVQLAVLAVPADAAQNVAEQLVEAGVKGILNFAPVRLRVNVPVQPIDLSRVLEQLAFEVASAAC
jgi:redox-sensing transcriptional repressor